MLDAQDIQKLMEVLATKDDIRQLDTRLSVLELKMDRVVEVLDKMTGRLEALHQE